MPNLNANDLDAASKIIARTGRWMGVRRQIGEFHGPRKAIPPAVRQGRARPRLPADRGDHPDQGDGQRQVRRDGQGPPPARRQRPPRRRAAARHPGACRHGSAGTSRSPSSPRASRLATPRPPGRASSAATTSARKVEEGWTDFDVAVSTPDMMRRSANSAACSAPRADADPKVGTVTDDIEKAVTDAKAAEVEYRTDRRRSSTSIGKASFDKAKLLDNYPARASRRSSAPSPSSARAIHRLLHALDEIGPERPGRHRPEATRPARELRPRSTARGGETAGRSRRDRRPVAAEHQIAQPVQAPPARQKPGAGETMNRERKVSGHRGDRRPDRGIRGDLAVDYRVHQRLPGRRAARQAARGRRQLPRRQEPADQTRRRQGRQERLPSCSRARPPSTFVRATPPGRRRRSRPSTESTTSSPSRAASWTDLVLDEDKLQNRSPDALPPCPRRPARRRRRQPADRPGPRARLDDLRASRCSSARSPRRPRLQARLRRRVLQRRSDCGPAGEADSSSSRAAGKEFDLPATRRRGRRGRSSPRPADEESAKASAEDEKADEAVRSSRQYSETSEARGEDEKWLPKLKLRTGSRS